MAAQALQNLLEPSRSQYEVARAGGSSRPGIPMKAVPSPKQVRAGQLTCQACGKQAACGYQLCCRVLQVSAAALHCSTGPQHQQCDAQTSLGTGCRCNSQSSSCEHTQ